MKFIDVAKYFDNIEKTTKRLEMFDILSNLFKETPNENIDKIIYICQEQIKPPFESLKIDMAEKMLQKSIARATGVSLKKVIELYKNKGDLGLVAEELSKAQKSKLIQPDELTLIDVYDSFLKTAKSSGVGSVDIKISIIAGILGRAKPLEAKYICRFIIGKLRLGVGDPTLMDSLSKAKIGDRSLREKIEKAYNLCSDLGEVAKKLFIEDIESLEKFKITPGKPIRMALAERLSTPEEIIEKIGKCAVEGKYDGFRLQCHKIGKQVKIFSRNLEEISYMFPEIVHSIKKYIKSEKAIIEGEAIVYNEATEELMPFQVTMTRKRKYEIDKKSKELPLKLFIFDLLYINGKDYTEKPLRERIKLMEKNIELGNGLELAERIITENPEEVDRFFENVISRGLEGVLAKRLDAGYSAGGRNYDWIKLKRGYKGDLTDTIDVVIIGYIKGRGARAKFGIGALLAGVYDKKEDSFKSIARIGSGFSEEKWQELKSELDKISLKQKPARIESEIKPDVWVEPKYVIEVAADEITKSPMHTAGRTEKESGYALRFPRAKSFIRVDKKAEDATSVEEIKKMHKMQSDV